MRLSRLARLVDREEALALLANVTGSFAADGLAARLRLDEDPELAAAFADLDAGETERALDALISAIAASDGERKEDLRRVVVGVLDSLGVEHPRGAGVPAQARISPVLGRRRLRRQVREVVTDHARSSLVVIRAQTITIVLTIRACATQSSLIANKRRTPPRVAPQKRSSRPREGRIHPLTCWC